MPVFPTFSRLGFPRWPWLGKAFTCHECMSNINELEVYDLQGIKRGDLDD